MGGHVANIPDLARRIDADHVVRGEGVRWFRTFLGEDPEQPVRHPQIIAGHGTRTVGITAPENSGDMAATVIPSVGCPVGCNFCSTSAMFGGKGHSVRFYQTGDELFDIMCQLEANLKVQSFFMMDENFLLDRGAGPAAPGTHGAARQGLGLLPVQFRRPRCAPTAPSNSCGWG